MHPLSSRRKWVVEGMIKEVMHPWKLMNALKYPSQILDQITNKHHELLDRTIAAFTNNRYFVSHGFFADGWGDIEILQKIRQELEQVEKVKWSIPNIQIEWTHMENSDHGWVVEGEFDTPNEKLAMHLPEESQKAYFQLVIPRSWGSTLKGDPQHPLELLSPTTDEMNSKAMTILLPGTGEHGFLYRRTAIARPLQQEGIATLILEGSFYGKRKPPKQVGPKLRQVSDLPLLGRTTIEESRALLQWLRKSFNFSCLTVAGSSMGGLHAAMSSTLVPFPVGMVAWMAPPSAIPAFVHGLLASCCDWESLSADEKLSAIEEVVQDKPLVQSYDRKNTVDNVKCRLKELLSITNIDHFPRPACPEASIIALAERDQYIGTVDEQWRNLCTTWQGAQVKTYRAGHVSGILFQQQEFCRAIKEASSLVATK